MKHLARTGLISDGDSSQGNELGAMAGHGGGELIYTGGQGRPPQIGDFHN